MKSSSLIPIICLLLHPIAAFGMRRINLGTTVLTAESPCVNITSPNWPDHYRDRKRRAFINNLEPECPSVTFDYLGDFEVGSGAEPCDDGGDFVSFNQPGVIYNRACGVNPPNRVTALSDRDVTVRFVTNGDGKGGKGFKLQVCTVCNGLLPTMIKPIPSPLPQIDFDLEDIERLQQENSIPAPVLNKH